MCEYAVEAKKINIGFDGVRVLHDLDFSVKKSEIHALVGTNGAGKSTLMKIINGVYKKDSGDIFIFGKKADYETPEGARRAGIAMVFQDLSLIPTLTVSENIFLQTNPYRKGVFIDDKKNGKKAAELLEKIGVHGEVSPNERVEQLSIGKQQIVEIAKALSYNPKVLILDEPTASLSKPEIEKLFAVMNTLKSQGISIIYITHYLQDIFKICDSITLLRDGKTLFRKNTDELDLQFLIDSMSGGESRSFSWNREKIDRTQPALFEAKNISTAHIKDISLKLYPGEVAGIAGLLGSGRSELLQSLFGIDKLQTGKIFIQGKPVSLDSPADAIEHGISLVPENRREQGLVLDFPVSENVVLSIVNRLKKFFVIDKQKSNKIVRHYIRSLNVKTQGPGQLVRYLSGGNQQKVVVAKCLASDSKVLLLDDPTFGVDIQAKREIMKIIHDFAAKGNAVLFVSSEFNEIASFCDSVYIMKKGRITEVLSEKVTEEELLRKVQ